MRNFARRLENKLDSKKFRPADDNTPAAIEKALKIAVKQGLASRGDYFEFGVYRGFTFWHAQNVVTKLGNDSMRFFGLDSFCGLPTPKGIDEYKGDFYTAQYRADLAYVREMLDRHGVDWDRTFLIPGYYKDTLTVGLRKRHGLSKAAVVLIDSDLYQSASQALDFVGQLLMDGSIIVFDDWNAFDRDDQRGERRAFREFLEARPQWGAVSLFSYGAYGQAFTVHVSKQHAFGTTGENDWFSVQLQTESA